MGIEPNKGVGHATAAHLLPPGQTLVLIHPLMQRGVRTFCGVGGVHAWQAHRCYRIPPMWQKSRGRSPRRTAQHPPPESRAYRHNDGASRGREDEGEGGEGWLPFTGEEAAVVLPTSSRMLTSSPISRSSLRDDCVHAQRPSEPCWMATRRAEREPADELMYSLSAATALAAAVTLKVCARATQRFSLSAQNDGGGVWCDMIAVGAGATGGSAIANRSAFAGRRISCPSDF